MTPPILPPPLPYSPVLQLLNAIGISSASGSAAISLTASPVFVQSCMVTGKRPAGTAVLKGRVNQHDTMNSPSGDADTLQQA